MLWSHVGHKILPIKSCVLAVCEKHEGLIGSFFLFVFCVCEIQSKAGCRVILQEAEEVTVQYWQCWAFDLCLLLVCKYVLTASFSLLWNYKNTHTQAIMYASALLHLNHVKLKTKSNLFL